MAVCPAVTVAVPEFPGATRPQLAMPIPNRGMIKGMDVFAETVSVPLYGVLNVAGVNVTVNVQEAFTASCWVHPFRLVGIVKTGNELTNPLVERGEVPQF